MSGESLNAPVIFSRSVAAFPAVCGDANVLSHFGGAELSRPALAETASDIHRRPDIASLSAGIGIPEILKLHWLKRLFARKSVRCIYINTTLHICQFCGCLGLIQAARRRLERACP